MKSRKLIIQKELSHPHFEDLKCLSVLKFKIYFTVASQLFFNFPSRYFFTIDLFQYLAFSLLRWNVQTGGSTSFSFFPHPILMIRTLATGLSPSLVFTLGIQVWLFGFHSPLLTESLLIYFPSITKMFQFIEFLLGLSFKVSFSSLPPPVQRTGGRALGGSVEFNVSLLNFSLFLRPLF